jgi:hypothetical protein
MKMEKKEQKSKKKTLGRKAETEPQVNEFMENKNQD